MSAQDYEKRSVVKDIRDAHNKANSDRMAANLNISYTPLFLAPLYL